MNEGYTVIPGSRFTSLLVLTWQQFRKYLLQFFWSAIPQTR